MGKLAKRIAIGAAVAGAAGYVAGLMTAPKSGKETRHELAQAAGSSMGDIEKQLKNMHTELGKVVDEAKDRSDDLSGKAQKELKTLIERAKDSKQKVRELISAVHDGDADDKDLKRAINDAKHAMNHVREFLSK